MSLVTLVFVLVLLCLCIYGVQFLPGPSTPKNLLCAVVVLAAVVYLARGAGL